MSARSDSLPPIALSLGDPAGVGPELIACAWADRSTQRLDPFFLEANPAIIREAAAMRGVDCPVVRISDPAEAGAAFGEGLPVIETDNGDYRPGNPDREGAVAALHSLDSAIAHTLAGRASAVVTAPVAKAELASVGFPTPGQTEYLALKCDVMVQDTAMMLAGPTLRTVPLTIHVAIADVPKRLSVELIVRRARVVARALQRDFGLERPRLAVAGLNPHAGENGAFGDEEARIIEPAIRTLREDGFDVTGPHAADALFTPHSRDGFDVALCMYHDQALIPIKALDFDQGVNVTLGLPIIRTSPDHGTAFDIAGERKADPGAMIAAIRMAGDCARRRAGHRVDG
ncbi:4-hydroxythreonine-4-phosphate dehydrogenase PdxA [Erythrobacter sp. HKB08]|uniref:4-hydroxythreonine-4-phosphate dehydrogenase PdxA n=1 Tax=Erythrobacter sp. HKB08 TaxID=2502843 RepID=UPI001F3EB729|nr:4-hydroxythreonine-4-phosphate dehydrogenase PdxA [Erythrobacter sp. HKB08]